MEQQRGRGQFPLAALVRRYDEELAFPKRNMTRVFFCRVCKMQKRAFKNDEEKTLRRLKTFRRFVECMGDVFLLFTEEWR